MKIFRHLLVVCCLMAGLWPAASHAVRLEQPYVVEVPVNSQAQVERQEAEKGGLLLLLERLTGQRLDEQPKIKAALPKAESFVQQFSYLQAVTPLSNAAAAPGWRLQLVFSASAVNALLDQVGVALWPLDRPQVLLLVANERAALLPPGGGDALLPLQQAGQVRGVPLLLPDPAQQDLTVAAAVQALDAASLLPLQTAYKADAILLGSVSGDDEKGWSGQWLLQVTGQEQRFPAKAATFQLLVEAAVRDAAGLLAGNYRSSATADAGPATLRLQVDGIRSYAAFTRLRQYLETLEAVQRIENTQINGSTVIIDLQVKGRESFRSLAALFKPLQWQEEIAPPPGGDGVLHPVWHYQWVE